MAVELFQERFRELPIFQKYMEFLDKYLWDSPDSLEEIATRLLMMSENGLNWDTLCQNCGVFSWTITTNSIARLSS